MRCLDALYPGHSGHLQACATCRCIRLGRQVPLPRAVGEPSRMHRGAATSGGHVCNKIRDRPSANELTMDGGRPFSRARNSGNNHAFIYMIARGLHVHAGLRLVGVGWLGVIRRNIRNHVVQVDRLIHLKTPVTNDIGDLHWAENYAHCVALALEAQARDPRRGPSRRQSFPPGNH